MHLWMWICSRLLKCSDPKNDLCVVGFSLTNTKNDHAKMTKRAHERWDTVATCEAIDLNADNPDESLCTYFNSVGIPEHEHADLIQNLKDHLKGLSRIKRISIH